MNDRSLVEGYNLFGDPALPLAVPGHRLALRVTGEPSDLRLEIDLGVPAFVGAVIVDWLDERGTVLDSETVELAEPSLALPLHPDAAVRSAAVYAWSLGTGWDAAGGITLSEPAVDPSFAVTSE
jgi:hypothetical protein